MKVVKESLYNFEKTGNVKSGLKIGKVSMLEEKGFEFFKKWLNDGGIDSNDAVDKCWPNNYWGGYNGGRDLQKERWVFDGFTIGELDPLNPEIVNRYHELISELFDYDLWPMIIGKKTEIVTDDMTMEEADEQYNYIEDLYGENHFLPNLLKYSIDKWEIEI